LLDRQTDLDPANWECGYVAACDWFPVEWERAAWAHAGRPDDEVRTKRKLVRWRLHTLLAELTGDLAHFYAAAMLCPDFPARHAGVGWALGRAGRLAESVDHLSRAVAANPLDQQAARAFFESLRTMQDTAGQQRLARERRLLAQTAPQAVPPESWFMNTPAVSQPGRAGLAEAGDANVRRSRIVWEGDQWALHSLALVNRELCFRLVERGHEVGLRADSWQSPERSVLLPERLVERLGAPFSGGVDIHLPHGWPRDFTAPATGHWVMMQPWEYGSLPKSWIEPIAQQVDDIWAYTDYVRECYLNAGVPADRVHVVPLGVDPTRFHRQVRPLPLRTTKR